MLGVVYLIFNEGYGGRGELAGEAIRLGGALAELMPDEPEVHGLVAEAGDVEAALELVEQLDLERYHYLHSTRAELLRRLGHTGEASAAYDRALDLVDSDAERRFLERRRDQL